MYTEQLLRTKKTVQKPETHKRKINKRKTEEKKHQTHCLYITAVKYCKVVMNTAQYQ